MEKYEMDERIGAKLPIERHSHRTCHQGTNSRERLYRRSAGRLFIGPATRSEAILPDRVFRRGQDQSDRSNPCRWGRDGQVAQHAVARGALVVMVTHDSDRDRQYQRDQQDGNDETPDSR